MTFKLKTNGVKIKRQLLSKNDVKIEWRFQSNKIDVKIEWRLELKTNDVWKVGSRDDLLWHNLFIQQ